MSKKLSTKALPSSPIWTQLNMPYGQFAENRWRLWTLMALYCRTDIVHGCIDLNAKAVVAANPRVCRLVNKGAKSLRNRGLKRLPPLVIKKLADKTNIEDDEELVEVTDSPFIDALNNESLNGMKFHDIIRLTAVSLEIYGLAFVVKNRGFNNAVVGYQHLPTWAMTPNRDGEGYVLNWIYSPIWGDRNEDVSLSIDDILVFRWASTTDPIASGDSPLLSALTKLELQGKWLDYQSWLVGNKCRPDWLYIPKTPDGVTLSQEQVERTEKKINDKYRGPGAGRIHVADSQGAIQPLNWAPTDMAPLAFDDNLKRAVLWALHIPEAFTSMEANRANAEAAYEFWARNSITPLISIIENVFSIEAESFDETLLFVFESVIPEDQLYLLEVEKVDLSKWNAALSMSATTKDEYREQVLGLAPLTPNQLEDMTPKETDTSPAQEEKEEVDADNETYSFHERGTYSFHERETTEEKSLAVSSVESVDLLAINREVHSGVLDRATAVNLLAYSLKIDQQVAKTLITKKKKPLVEISTPLVEVSHIEEVETETTEEGENVRTINL